LERWADAEPHDPWLFYPHPRGWKWISFASAWRRVAGAAAALGDLPAAGAVALAAEVSVPALLLDLAVQHSGRSAVPLRAQRWAEWIARWPSSSSPSSSAEAPVGGVPPLVGGAGPSGREDFPAELPWVELAGLAPEVAPPTELPESLASHEAAAGGCLATAGEPWRSWSAGAWAASALRIAGALEANSTRPAQRPPGRPPGRDIVVLARALDQPVARLCFGWAAWSGAALLLEPNPGAFLPSAAWARPTVLAVSDRGELSALREQVAVGGRTPGRKPSWRSLRREARRPFGRLRAVLCPPELAGGEDDRAWWQQRGVGLVALE
jgi:hypothetical protein